MKTLKELYSYREMIFSLVRKDLRGRYKGSALGFLWTFINPLLQLVVYTLVFSTIMKQGIEDFYLFLFVALIPWIFFSSSLTGGANIILGQKDMVKKIYFPREVLPISYVISCFINMILTFIVIFIVLILSGKGINLNAVIYLPIIMLIEFIMSLGVALLSSSITVYFRDLEHILNIVGMAWMYLTPILYPIDMVPKQYNFIFNLNPMTPVISAYREILYYGNVPHIETLSHAVIMGIITLILGFSIFSLLKKNFAEEL